MRDPKMVIACVKMAIGNVMLVMLLLASLLGLQRSVNDLRTASREKSPTQITVEHWDQYKGQRWLAVEGHLAVARMAIHSATDQINRGKGNVYAYVPIVAEEAGNEPVHAVAVIGPMPGSEARKILLRRAGLTTIVGQIAPDGVYDHSRLMPSERMDPQVVFVNEDTQPHGGAGMWFFVVLMLGSLFFCLIYFWRSLKLWMRFWKANATVPIGN